MHPYNHKLDNIELYSLSGIDLVSLVKDYKGKSLHPLDKAWLDLSSRGGRDGNVVANIGKLYLIFMLIIEMDLFRFKNELRDFYKNMSRKRMQVYIPNSTDINIIKRLLKASGVVDIMEKSSSGKFSHGYRINPKHQFRRRIPLYDTLDKQYHFLPEAYDNWHKKKKKKQYELTRMEQVEKASDEPIDIFVDNSILFKWLRKCHNSIAVDKTKAVQALDKCLADPEHRLNNDTYDVALTDVEAISDWDKDYGYPPKFDRSQATNRITSTVNLLSRITRPYLRYKGEKIHWIDINACHPFLLLSLYKDISPLRATEEAYKRVVHLLTERKITAEYRKYYRLWTKFHMVSHNGKEKRRNDYYRSIIEMGGLDMDRDKLKSTIMQNFLYSSYRDKRLLSVGKVYRKEFPLLDAHMKHMKTTIVLPPEDHYWVTYDTRLEAKRHQRKSRNKKTGRNAPPQEDILYSQLSYINMRMEAEAVIQNAANGLLAKLGKNFFCLTLHDALGVQKKYIHYAKAALTKSFTDITGKRPKFKQ